MPRQSPAPNPVVPNDVPLHERVAAVGSSLSLAIRRLLDDDPPLPHLASRLSRAYGMNHVSSHRLAVAIRNSDPLATMHHIPGPEPLRRLVKAAQRQAPADRVRAAAAAIDSFEALIKQVASDRAGLDAIISAWLPDARARFEGEAKQAIYRGMRQLKGIAAELKFVTTMIHPGDNPNRFDWVCLRGLLGLRCIRPGASSSFQIQTQTDFPAMARTLDDAPLQDNPLGAILPQFCSGPALDIAYSFSHDHNNATFDVNWNGAVGIPSAGDLITAEFRRHLMRRYRDEQCPRLHNGHNYVVSVPTKAIIFDTIFHRDAYPDAIPFLKIYELDNEGLVDPADPSSHCVAYDVDETVEPLGADIERFRAKDNPRYIELLRHVCDKLGWSPHELRCYRSRIEYPICGARHFIAWEVPEAPTVH